MGGFLPYILLVMLPSIAITGWAAWRVKSTYSKWSKVDSGINLDAFEFARQLLDRQGLRDVKIEPVPGQLTDHYDPRGKVLRVSQAVAGGSQLGSFDPSQSILGVPRSAGGGPRLSVASAAVIAHEVGHAMQDRQRDPWMVVRQAIVPAVPVGSAIAPWLILSSLGLYGERQDGARDVLKAAAWTYVAAALSALLTFLYYLFLIMGRRD